MGAITFSIDTRLVETLVKLIELDTFIETGTYRGDTVAIVRPYFRRIISIERDRELFEAASTRFADDPGVTLLHGDAAHLLRNLAAELQRRKVLYWLDAHWCLREDGQEDEKRDQAQCSLLAELSAIHRLDPDSVVLIDDARFFLSPPVAPSQYSQWPHLSDLLAALQALNPEHRLLILNDVIIFYPPRLEEALYAFAHEHGVDWLIIAHQSEANQRLVQDNLDKEAEIQRLAAAIELLNETLAQHQVALAVAHFDRRLSPLYWARRTIGPFWRPLKKPIHGTTQAARNFMLRGKMLAQYPPRPLNLPAHYRHITLPAGELPLVTIVTPSFNQDHYLPRTIESVLAQGYPCLEYIVQDGASTDNTPAILEQYRSRLARANSAPDGGQADAINKGFQQSSGEIMAWLNSDDMLLPGALAYVVNYFQTHPHVDVVYGHRVIVDENDLEIGRWMLLEHDESILAWADYVPQETLFWRRSLWQKVGGYVDTSYQFAIDWELLLRFQKAGATFVRLPRFLAAFRVHDLQKTSALLNTLGQEEMTRLRTAAHGRPVSHKEIQRHVGPYLLRSAWLDQLAAWGFVRH